MRISLLVPVALLVTAAPDWCFQRELVLVDNGLKEFGSLVPEQECEYPHRTYPVNDPVVFRFGDLDGDGLRDVVVASAWGHDDGYVSVRLGTKKGTFGEEVQSIPVFDPVDVVLVDLDDDGFLDIVAGNVWTQDLTVCLGNGDGTFGVPTNYPLGAGTVWLGRGDFVGDGLRDVVAVLDSGEMHVFENLGTGGVGAPTVLAIPGAESSTHVLTQDFDGDGHRDIMLPRESSISVWFGDSNGGFVLTETSLATTALVDARIEDMDGDGDWDLVTVDDTSLTVYLNTSGPFTAQPSVALVDPVAPRGLALGDWDNDGDIDVAVGRSNGVNVFENDGGGGLSFAQTHKQVGGIVRAHGVDVDHDGDDDYVSIRGTAGLQILRNDGSGLVSVDLYLNEYTADGSMNSFATGDLDGDGHLDVVGVDADFNDAFVVLMGLGGGAFGPSVGYDAPSYEIWSPTLRDMTGDGALDLVVIRHYLSGIISVFPGNGDGTFGAASEFQLSGSNLYMLDFLARDLDADGDVDLVVTTLLDGLWVLENTGGGTLVEAQELDVQFGSHAGTVAGDLDGDGDLDLLAPNNQYLGVYDNDGLGTFAFDGGYGFVGPDFTGGPVLADWDRDGWLDVAWAYRDPSFDHRVGVRMNNGLGGFQPPITMPSDDIRGLSARDLDGDGALELLGVGESMISIFENLGTGSQTKVFAPPVRYSAPGASQVRTVEFDEEGTVDLLVGSSTGLVVHFADCE